MFILPLDEQALQLRQAGIEGLEPIRIGALEGDEVGFRRPGAKAERETISTDLHERENAMRQFDRLVQWELENRCPQFDLLGCRCRGCQCRKRVWEHKPSAHCLGRPETVEALSGIAFGLLRQISRLGLRR